MCATRIKEMGRKVLRQRTIPQLNAQCRNAKARLEMSRAIMQKSNERERRDSESDDDDSASDRGGRRDCCRCAEPYCPSFDTLGFPYYPGWAPVPMMPPPPPPFALAPVLFTNSPLAQGNIYPFSNVLYRY